MKLATLRTASTAAVWLVLLVFGFLAGTVSERRAFMERPTTAPQRPHLFGFGVDLGEDENLVKGSEVDDLNTDGEARPLRVQPDAFKYRSKQTPLTWPSQHFGDLDVLAAAHMQRLRPGSSIPATRVPPPQRRFISDKAERVIARVVATLSKAPLTPFTASLATLFENCWPNTLDTTIMHISDSLNYPDAFVITGDIPAMWLRDSTNQVAPYLSLLRDIPARNPRPADWTVLKLFLGVIVRQARSINAYPYANAFLYNSSDAPGSRDDRVYPPIPLDAEIPTHEAKYELDSLCAFLKISNAVFENLPADAKEHVTLYLLNEHWIAAVETVIGVMRDQQRGTMEEFGEPAYKFQRNTDTGTETLILGGVGVPVNRCGLIKSQFRPSDDASTLPFSIPSNAMAAVELERLVKVLRFFGLHSQISDEAERLAKEIRVAIDTYGIVTHPIHGQIYAYEVDGYGSHYLMDDANVPSLLSLPYLGFTTPDDPLYLRTRAFVLSDANPYHFRGSAGEGVGGPHCGLGNIWPMAIIMRGLTSTDRAEQEHCFGILIKSAQSTGFMHESFWKDDVERYTRAHFAWANALLGEFVMKYAGIV